LKEKIKEYFNNNKKSLKKEEVITKKKSIDLKKLKTIFKKNDAFYKAKKCSLFFWGNYYVIFFANYSTTKKN
jgi:hypothetical protein